MRVCGGDCKVRMEEQGPFRLSCCQLNGIRDLMHLKMSIASSDSRLDLRNCYQSDSDSKTAFIVGRLAGFRA